MEHKQICSSLIYDRLPPLSANYPWLVAQTLEEKEKDVNGEQIFYTVQNPMSHYRCRIPELLGRHIRGCSHGWLILSNGGKDKWSLWNPITSNLIRLPPLITKNGDSDFIGHCCLSSPPYTPGSIILFMRDGKPKIVFCRLDRNKKKKLKWIEMSYSKQLTSITEVEDDNLVGPICCNGKLYALSVATSCVIQLDIVAKEKEVVISLLPFSSRPQCYVMGRCFLSFLKGSCEQLFIITVGFTDITMNKLVDVCLFKLDMTSMVWEEMKELKDTVFFVDVDRDPSLDCSPPIPSELGGYVHILHKTSKVIYSYDVKDETVSLSSVHCLDLLPRSGNLRTSHISVWTMSELRLQGDDGLANKCIFDAKQDEEDKEDEMMVRLSKNDEVQFINKTNEPQLLNLPFHVLEKIMEFCVGVDYLNFRATCKLCHLAAPVIQWSDENEKVRRRLQAYSLSSPWLMSFEKDEGIITFTDPIFGDKYFIEVSEDFFYDKRILCSRFGWLLLYVGLQEMVFFNPFTYELHELPEVTHLDIFSFSAPPTSPDCTVIAFSYIDGYIYLHYVGREQIWHRILLDFGVADYSMLEFPFEFPVFCGRDVYSLTKEGGLQVLKGGDLSLEMVVAEAPKSCSKTWREYYLVKCDRHLLLVIVGDFGESVEVFKLNDSTKEWEKMDDLGRHVIYICDVTCVCMVAKTAQMENRIYFPKLRSKNGKMVFYSFETRRYHTINGRNVEENLKDIFETKWKTCPQAWIEPSWS